MTREYDVVVWGATGFTGKWVAKHLADHYPQSDLKWAIAGRNLDKLKTTCEFIELADNALPDQLIADSNDRESLAAVVCKTKVIISTVGPYAYYGSLLVELCAMHGTDYVDLTGEVPWMRGMIDRHSEAATVSGARIVHSCGFDSIPSDMGVYYTQQHAQKVLGGQANWIRYHLMKSQGGASGGTIESMMNVISEATKNKATRRLLGNPYSLNPDVRFNGPDKSDQSKVLYNNDVQAWTAPFVMAGINTRIVRRSNALMGFKYGEDFTYSETMVTGKGARGYLRAKTISAAVKTIVVGSISKLGRKALGLLLPSQGEGPDVDPANPGFYHIKFIAKSSQGDSLATLVSGDGDPGYGSTSKMLAESAVCLAQDDLDCEGGFWTPSSAMGDALLDRLRDKGGLTFKCLDS